MCRLFPAALALAALVLAGCAQDFDKGPAGRVTGKVKDGKKFYLVVDPAKGGKAKSGEAEKFRVSKYDYHDCVRGAKYPECVDD